MLFAILTIVGGLIAASSLVIAKNPNAGQLYAKIAPYQGFLGIALLGYGIYHLVIHVVPHLSALMGAPLTAALVISGLVLDILIGFLLGFGLISKWTAKSEAATEKTKATLARLVPIQVPMGLAAVVVGSLNLIGF